MRAFFRNKGHGNRVNLQDETTSDKQIMAGEAQYNPENRPKNKGLRCLLRPF